VWVKREWGWDTIAFQFSGMKGDNPGNWGPLLSVGHVEIVASGWSARWNGTQTAAPSAVASLYYDWRSFRAQRFAVKATPIGPGRVELKGVNRNASVMGATRWTFSEFELGTGAFVNPKPATKGQPPNFVLATVCTNCGSFDAYDDSPVTVAFATPGVYYWGVIGEAGGNQGLASGGGTGGAGCNGCHPYVTPVAIIVPGPGFNSSVPPGFLGEVVILPAMSLPYQLCLTTTELTVFSSAKLFLPLCRPVPKFSDLAFEPHFASIDAPAGLRFSSPSGPANRSSANATGGATTTIPIDLKYLNTFDAGTGGDFPLYITFDSSMAGSTVNIEIRLHNIAQPPRVHAGRQILTAQLVATPSVPLPKKLLTSFSWSKGAEDLLLDGPGVNYSAVHTYAALGFNTVGYVHTDFFLPLPSRQRCDDGVMSAPCGMGGSTWPTLPRYFYPGNRTLSE
jgi:hypothetical protein